MGSDPGFVDPDKMDFRLKPDAAPLQQGFQNIPGDQIGLQLDEYRKVLPPREQSLTTNNTNSTNAVRCPWISDSRESFRSWFTDC